MLGRSTLTLAFFKPSAHHIQTTKEDKKKEEEFHTRARCILRQSARARRVSPAYISGTVGDAVVVVVVVVAASGAAVVALFLRGKTRAHQAHADYFVPRTNWQSRRVIPRRRRRSQFARAESFPRNRLSNLMSRTGQELYCETVRGSGESFGHCYF